MMDFKTFNPKPNFVELEEEVLKFWDHHQIFQKSLEHTKDGQPFVFFEGPPTANAKPALHHVEARSFKDLIPRYQTMRGRYVARKAGWDTHGLPVELQIEKKLGISGKKQIESIKGTVRESIIEFNRMCKQSVWEFKDEWEQLTRRMGYWVDMDLPYITYHNKYIESIWAILKQAWDKDLVYQGYKVLPYCTRCGTALSSHEVAQGYKTVKDNSVYMKFKVKGQDNTFILSWTTTPWTLPGNVALAVGTDIDYVQVLVNGEQWVVAAARAEQITPGVASQKTFKGQDMVGWEYEPLFDVPQLHGPQSYKVYPADFVTTTDGTGVVHTAVMYGEDDYRLGEEIGLPKIHTVDEFGNFIKEVPDLGGLYAKAPETEEKIFAHLEAHNNLVKKELYEHEYPHCWRCNTPLLYYARSSWFIKMSTLRKELLDNNQHTNWNPSHIKEGRFGEWLTEAKDWAISRERYWGTPLPIWTCSKCKHHQMVGSVEDLHLNKNTYFFARHGEAQSNIVGVHSNYPETFANPLTDLGEQNAQKMGRAIKDLGGVDMIIASDILRTKMTAEIAGEILGVKVEYDARLREYDLGEYNGKPLVEFHKDWPVQKRWQQAPNGGETYMQLQTRVLDLVAELNNKYNGKRILIVTHGDVIWLLNQHYDLINDYPVNGAFLQQEISLTDLHRPYVDDLPLPCEKCGGQAKRVPEVLDVWFDSGAMPFAQWHAPFENQELATTQFPADYISEAIDQTRGWFYTLLAISTFLGKGPAYKNVVCLGHLLDEKGQKMSKSKGNILDPWALMNKQGADAVRWYMYSINQPGDSKLFAERDLDMVVRKNFLTIWNVLSFLVTYSQLDNWTPSEDGSMPENLDVLDYWVLAKTQELVNQVSVNLDNFDIFKSSRSIEEFINELSTWYVRRSRERKGPAFYATLHKVLKTLSLIMAPFTPFLSENIWQVVRLQPDALSVHLAPWPQVKELTDGEVQLLKAMEVVRESANIALNARKELALPIRQPLSRLHIVTKDGSTLSPQLMAILLSEVNIKQHDDKLSASDMVKTYSGNRLVEQLMIDTELSAELQLEGLARSLERLIQDMRKKNGLQVGQQVKLVYQTEDAQLQEAIIKIDQKKTFILGVESLAVDKMESFEVSGKKISLGLIG